MNPVAVAVDGLSYRYPDGTLALHGLSFTIRRGEPVGIIGANGAGKTTLLQHLNGCLIASSGSVTIGSCLVTGTLLPEIRKVVGMVFQNPDDQLFMPTVHDDVAFGPLNRGLSGTAVEERVQMALEAVSAAHLAGKPPYRLSCGEKKRVAIATVLAMEPSVLVMDEPTAGLDPGARREIMALLQAFDQTRIITSHDLDMVAEVCSRVMVLHNGSIMADGPAAEVFSNTELLAACRLEPPLSSQPCVVCRAGRIFNAR